MKRKYKVNRDKDIDTDMLAIDIERHRNEGNRLRLQHHYQGAQQKQDSQTVNEKHQVNKQKLDNNYFVLLGQSMMRD